MKRLYDDHFGCTIDSRLLVFPRICTSYLLAVEELVSCTTQEQRFQTNARFKTMQGKPEWQSVSRSTVTTKPLPVSVYCFSHFISTLCKARKFIKVTPPTNQSAHPHRVVFSPPLFGMRHQKKKANKIIRLSTRYLRYRYVEDI